MERAAIRKGVLLFASLLLSGAAWAGPVGPPAGSSLSPDDVILNKSTAQPNKQFNVPQATISTMTAVTVNAQVVKIGGVNVSTSITSGTSVYPATSTAIFPQGLAATTGSFSGTVSGSSVTLTGLLSGQVIHGSSAVITGTVSGSNLSGTNTGDMTIGTANGLSVSGQALSMTTASTVSTGSLRAVDFSTFNNKLSTNGNGSALTGLTKTQVGLSNVQNVDQTDASNLSSGQADPTVLGSGTPDSTKYLRGDGAWSVLNSTAAGLGQVTNNAQVKKTDYTQKGGFLVGIGTGGVYAVQAPGTDGYVLVANSLSPTGLSYIVPANSYTIYPATATAYLAKGAVISTLTVQGQTLFQGLVNGTTLYFSSGTFTGQLTSANLSGNNSGDVTIGTANGLVLQSQLLSLSTSSATQNGALTSTDWTRFDAKQATFTVAAPITYTGGVVGIDKSSATLLGPAPTTSSIPEGSNLYFTTARATSSISNTSPITYSNGVVGIQTAATTSTGALTATDWNTFNNKTSTFGATLTNVTISSATILNFTMTGGTITPTAITGTFVDLSTRTISGTQTFSNGRMSGTLTDVSTTTHSGQHTFTGIVAISSSSVSTMTVTSSIQWPDGYVEKAHPPFVNVKDYGAVGDGNTDDSAAATAACTAVGNTVNAAGIVYFPPGKYKLNWVIGNNKCSVLGDELGTQFVALSTSLPMVSYYGTGPGGNIARRFMKGITFQGTANALNGGRGVYINCPGFISFQNCRFSDLAYGVYKNSSEWINYHDCSFSDCLYAAFSTTINGDIFGNNPTANINSGEDYFVQSMFVSNTLGYYTDNVNDVHGDQTHASSFISCVFVSNGLPLGAGDVGQATYQTMLVSQGYFEDNGTGGGTVTANGNVMNYGNIDFRGGSLALDHMDSISGSGGIRISGSSYVRGTDLRLNSCPIAMSTDTASYFVMDGLVSDANGGSGFNIEVPEALAPYSGNRPALAISPARTAFVTNFGSRNLINETATCMRGTLPGTYSGSPTTSFMFGDGYYGNTCVKVSGSTNAGVNWTATVSTSNFYVTTFAIRQDTGTVGNMNLQLNNLANIVTPNPQLTLSNQWKTYGIVGNSNTAGTTTLGMVLLQSGTFYVSCVQMVAFPTLAEAVAFYDSRTFVLKPDEVSNRQYQASAAPTSGTWVAGDIAWNTAPSTGTSVGFVCITGGTPGTWMPFGTVNPNTLPAFSVNNGTGPVNLTGAGVAVTVPWATTVFDNNSNFSNNTFTAPVTGKYQLSTCVALIGIDTTTVNATRIVRIQTTARNYASLFSASGPNTNNTWSGCANALADMSAGDTAVVKIYADTQTKTVGLYPGADDNFFTGYLVGR